MSLLEPLAPEPTVPDSLFYGAHGAVTRARPEAQTARYRKYPSKSKEFMGQLSGAFDRKTLRYISALTNYPVQGPREAARYSPLPPIPVPLSSVAAAEPALPAAAPTKSARMLCWGVFVVTAALLFGALVGFLA